MNFDDLLISLGEFGPYQKFIYFSLCLTAITIGMQKFVWVFLIMEPKYRCKLVIDQFGNGSTLPYDLPDEILNRTIPYDSGSHDYSKCMRYKTFSTATPIFSNWTVYDEEIRFTRQTEYCSSYVYDTSDYSTTLVTEFDLVCSHAWEQAHGQAIYVVGELIAALTCGHVADRYGRRRVILAGTFGHILFGFLCSCASSHAILLVVRFIMGFSSSCYMSAFVLVMEFIGPSYRMEAGNSGAYFFSLGYLLVLPFAYFIRDWRYLQMAISLPSLVLLSYWWTVPESPRWLMTNNKIEDSRAILEKVASSNKTSIPKDLRIGDLDENESTTPEETFSPLTLFKYAKLRIRIIVSCYIWSACCTVYYGLALNSGNLGGNVYINFLLSAALEFPATFLAMYVLRYAGRVKGLSLTFLVAGTALAATCIVPEGHVAVVVTLAIIGKFAITISFNIVYIHGSEVFPTVVRTTALGMCSSCARIGAISAPYIALLSNVWKRFPLVVFGVEALLAAGLALILPETKNKTLPETIQDGENFGVNTEEPRRTTANTHLKDLATPVPKYCD